MSDKPNECGWMGYGFGATYYDAVCCSGTIGDADDVVGDSLIGLRDDVCPQCDGTGQVVRKVGPMALIRQRELAHCIELCQSVKDSDLRELLEEQFAGWHGLVNHLESKK